LTFLKGSSQRLEMAYLQLFFNFLFIAGLIAGSISGFNLWRISRKFARRLKTYLPQYYSQSFLDLANPNKYKNLNLDIQSVITDSENTDDLLKLRTSINKIKTRYYLKDNFEDFLIEEIERFKENIILWKKIGNFAIWSSLIGAIGSIIFLIL